MIAHTAPRPGAFAEELSRLMAEGERIRRRLLRSGLAVVSTIAAFPEAKPDSIQLEEACRTAVRRAVGGLERLLPGSGEEDLEVAEKINRLREALAGRDAKLRSEEEFEPPHPERRNTRGPDALTARETEVLKCIARGHSTKKVAAMLGITFKTAACHRYRVMDKLGIHETANLVRYAIRNGMVEP